MVKVTRYSVWGSRRGQTWQMSPEGFWMEVHASALGLGLSRRTACKLADTAVHVAQINDRFSLGAHIRYSLERVA